MPGTRKTIFDAVIILWVAGALAGGPTFGLATPAYATQQNTSKKTTHEQPTLSEDQLPAFAISLAISVATEARSYADLTLRPHVMARAADVLWDADNLTARELFKRAWDEAEKGDADEVFIKSKRNLPALGIALLRASGFDLRLQVLKVIAQRDRALAEEFFSKLKHENDSAARQKESDHGWSVPDAVSKRLQVAEALLERGETEKALEFASPVLNQVNVHTINFLSALRRRNAEAADQKFAAIMANAEYDPLADANAVSGLSSYLFTPGLYVTIKSDGATRWTQPDELPTPPTNISAALREKFFQVAAKILLRPITERTLASDRTIKFTIIKRLLPLFETHAPQTTPALRAHMVELAGGPNKDITTTDSFLLTQGIKSEPSVNDALEQMQSALDRAPDTRERDAIYAAAAGALLSRGDLRARDLAEKIDNRNRREQLRQMVDFELVQQAIRKKSLTAVIRFIQTGQLTPTQRASAYIDAARLALDAKSHQPLEFLEKAIQETQRVQDDKPGRALLLTGIANQMIRADQIRAWEIMAEAVKTANMSEEFTGENVLKFSLTTRSGMKMMEVGGENYSLTKIFQVLAKDDLYRALDLAKSFKYDAPRAAVTLAIASSILQKEKTGLQN